MPAPRKPAWYSSRYWWLLHDITANRSSRRSTELATHRVGEAQDAVAVLFERGVVVAVVDADSVGPSLHGGEELTVEDELFHVVLPALPLPRRRVVLV